MKKEYDFSKGVRGAAIPTPGMTRIWLYIDDEILEWFSKRIEKANGGSCQTDINAALRDFINSETLRRVLREELAPRSNKRRKRST